MGFEKKLYEIELTPPPQVWEKLKISLDEMHFESHFRNKLETLEGHTPTQNWQDIEKKLESQFEIEQSLSNLTAQPPADTWNRIVQKMGTDEMEQIFASSLSKLEVIPPFVNQQMIFSELDKSQLSKPVIRKFLTPIRIAAAAVVIGLIAWGGFRFLTNEKASVVDENSVAIEKNTPAEKTKLPAAKESSIPELKEETTPLSAIALSAKTKTNKQGLKKKSVPAITPAIHSSSEEIVADIRGIENENVGRSENNLTAGPRYLFYLDEQCSMMKVSKKLADMTCIYSKDGAVSQDALAALNNKYCGDILKSWQEKISKATLHATFDPLEFAEILK